jgi:hypothetical protein
MNHAYQHIYPNTLASNCDSGKGALGMKSKLKILILIKRFADKHPKQKPKFDMISAIEEFAEVHFWHDNGNIFDILKSLKEYPDFIFHYDIAGDFKYAPAIVGLGEVDIPKGCFVIDTHNYHHARVSYFEEAKVDLIFSVTKHPFLNEFPKYREKFIWLPFAINPDVIKDWGLDKSKKFLLMGQVNCEYEKYSPKRNPPKGRYPFREAVLQRMEDVEGFVFHPHPGHFARQTNNLMVSEKYAQELNQSRIFFTCGGEFQYPVLKFFEAPGCRTLLLAEPNPDILELGFSDGVNFVASDRSDFYEKSMYYNNYEEERKRITDNGYRFIQTYHTTRVRAQQFIEYIEEF